MLSLRSFKGTATVPHSTRPPSKILVSPLKLYIWKLWQIKQEISRKILSQGSVHNFLLGGWGLVGGLGPPRNALAQANPRDWFQSQAPPRFEARPFSKRHPSPSRKTCSHTNWVKYSTQKYGCHQLSGMVPSVSYTALVTCSHMEHLALATSRVGGWHLAGGLGPPSYALAQANPRDWFQSQAPQRFSNGTHRLAEKPAAIPTELTSDIVNGM